MAADNCVWFRNKLTGYVDGVAPGSAAHRRLLSEVTEGDEPMLVWEQLDKPPAIKSVKYTTGMQARVFTVDPSKVPPTADRAPEADPEKLDA